MKLPKTKFDSLNDQMWANLLSKMHFPEFVTQLPDAVITTAIADCMAVNGNKMAFANSKMIRRCFKETFFSHALARLIQPDTKLVEWVIFYNTQDDEGEDAQLMLESVNYEDEGVVEPSLAINAYLISLLHSKPTVTIEPDMLWLKKFEIEELFRHHPGKDFSWFIQQFEPYGLMFNLVAATKIDLSSAVYMGSIYRDLSRSGLLRKAPALLSKVEELSQFYATSETTATLESQKEPLAETEYHSPKKHYFKLHGQK